MSAEEIKSLSNLSPELQEEFLKELIESSNRGDRRDINIEIDGVIYNIPMAVSHLIDSLVLQIRELHEIRNDKGN
jgi:hypothetical protein|tara:strand:- start:398 stop:622 length:225 start_codon:yes stop_codon:yes gene_type:complete